MVLIVGGLGAAAFHPPAAALAHRLGGAHRGLAMSVHITGGTLGFSLGPLLFAPAAQHFGLEWTPLLAIPGLMVIALFLSRVPPHRDPPRRSRGLRRASAVRPAARAALRHRGAADADLARLRNVRPCDADPPRPLVDGGGGHRRRISVRQRRRRFFRRSRGGPFRSAPRHRVVARALPTPFLLAAPLLSGWAFILTFAIGGFFLQSTLPVNVTFGQELAPVSAATVSSLMMGFAWGMGGFSVPIVGAHRGSLRD